MIELLSKYFPALLGGLRVTAELTGIAWSIGLAIGIPFGAVAGARNGLPKIIVRPLAISFSALPTLVVLFWVHYPLQQLLHIVVDPFYTAAFVLSLVNVVFVADVVSRAVENMPTEWGNSALVLGLDYQTILRRITIPLAARQIIAPVLVLQVNVLHATLFASLISVEELFRVTQRINSIEYDPVSSYSLLVIFFFIVCVPLHLAASLASRRFARDLSLR